MAINILLDITGGIYFYERKKENFNTTNQIYFQDSPFRFYSHTRYIPHLKNNNFASKSCRGAPKFFFFSRVYYRSLHFIYSA